MALRQRTWIIAGSLLVAAGLLYVNRLQLLKYSLGWYTDLRHPRSANHPVPWMDGPLQPSQPVTQRPPNVIIILADEIGRASCRERVLMSV